jgi:hypothetical protein
LGHWSINKFRSRSFKIQDDPRLSSFTPDPTRQRTKRSKLESKHKSTKISHNSEHSIYIIYYYYYYLFIFKRNRERGHWGDPDVDGRIIL